jgi:hypothetical protein
VYHTREYYNQDPVQRGLSKLLGKFAGPSLITERLGENSYKVQVGSKELVFNTEFLAPYRGEEPPIYRPRPKSSLLDGDDNGGGSGTSPEQKSSSSLPEIREEKATDEPGVGEESNPGQIQIEEEPQSARGKPEPEGNHLLPTIPSESLARQSQDDQKAESPEELQEQIQGAKNSDDFRSQVDQTQNPKRFIGQWILAYDKELHKKRKKSLTMCKVTDLSPGSCLAQVYKPRGVQKKIFFLPLKFKMKTLTEYDTKVSDAPDKGWEPWIVDLAERRGSQEVWVATAESKTGEDARFPPQRFMELYQKVWDGLVAEATGLAEYASFAIREGAKKRIPMEQAFPDERSKRVRLQESTV